MITPRALGAWQAVRKPELPDGQAYTNAESYVLLRNPEHVRFLVGELAG